MECVGVVPNPAYKLVKQGGGGRGSEECHEHEVPCVVQTHHPPPAKSPDSGGYEDVAISPCALYSEVPAVSLPLQPRGTDGGRPSAEAGYVHTPGYQ